ncbi:hypothetical protein XAB3213_540014 [Xanthomonas citri pv. bilvae]|nr:hypothetical protein XAB3213_540014 [Xanthomonas citri pv. bilvae]
MARVTDTSKQRSVCVVDELIRNRHIPLRKFFRVTYSLQITCSGRE